MMTKLREEFESWYQGLMGTPDNVLKNLRSGDSYRETDGERLNIAWHAYQAASKASKLVVLQGGRLKPDGKFWYDEDTISNILYQAGIEVKK